MQKRIQYFSTDDDDGNKKYYKARDHCDYTGK